MRNVLLATTAIALVSSAGTASAQQSVLERVLGAVESVNTSPDVTGVFANTASNVGETAFGTTTEVPVTLEAGDVISFTYTGSGSGAFSGTVVAEVNADGSVDVLNEDEVGSSDVTAIEGGSGVTVAIGAQVYQTSSGTRTLVDSAIDSGIGTAGGLGSSNAVFATVDTGTYGIDGSISNVVDRIQDATASVGSNVEATSNVTTNFGSMATTALGAVNTGEIGLGTNQDVQEAVADASTAVDAVVTQVGTDVGETVVSVNSALNTMGVNGSIENTITGVNASVASIDPETFGSGGLAPVGSGGTIDLANIGNLLGTIETTALGAVNTGTIVSGVNNQVSSTVASITGNSATNMFGETPAPDPTPSE